MQRQRILWADNLKGFLILLVVLGHVIQYSCESFDDLHLYNYIYSFHMPAFMTISGFLAYKFDGQLIAWGAVSRRAIRLMIPYIIWTILFSAVTGFQIWESIFVSPVYWFLILLFIIQMMMTLCQWLAHTFKWKSELICATMVLLLFALKNILNPKVLSLNIIHVHFFFYAMGWYLRKYETKMIQDVLLIPCGILFMFLGYFYERNASPEFMHFSYPVLYFLLSGSVGTLFSVMLLKRFADMNCKFLGRIGKMTLGIYVIHILICYVLKDYYHQFTENFGNIVGIAILFLMTSFTSVFFTWLFENNKYTRFLIGSRV